MNLCDSILRTRYRNSWTEPEMMSKNKVYPITVLLTPTSNLFKAGHRIRVDISSSNFPRFDINPNTGEPMGRHTHTQPAQNTIHLDQSIPIPHRFAVSPDPLNGLILWTRNRQGVAARLSATAQFRPDLNAVNAGIARRVLNGSFLRMRGERRRV